MLATELRKIEARKKERIRKQQDLQKLISQAEHNTERWVWVWQSLSNSSMLVLPCSRKTGSKKTSGSSKKTKTLGATSQPRVFF